VVRGERKRAVAIACWWSPYNQPGFWLLNAAPGQNGRFAAFGPGGWGPACDLVRPTPWAYDGLLGEGSNPVPLPPPLHCSPLYPIVRIDSKNNE